MSRGNEERRPAGGPDGARNLIVGDDISNGTAEALRGRWLQSAFPTDDVEPDIVAEVGRRTVWWSADTKNLRMVYLACETVGSKRMRDPLVGMLCSPVTHASDVIACLEFRHRLNVRLVEVDR